MTSHPQDSFERVSYATHKHPIQSYQYPLKTLGCLSTLAYPRYAVYVSYATLVMHNYILRNAESLLSVGQLGRERENQVEVAQPSHLSPYTS